MRLVEEQTQPKKRYSLQELKIMATRPDGRPWLDVEHSREVSQRWLAP